MGEDRGMGPRYRSVGRPDREGSIAASSINEAIAVISLIVPTWKILRAPFRFDLYRTRPGQSIHFLLTACAAAALGLKSSLFSSGQSLVALHSWPWLTDIPEKFVHYALPGWNIAIELG